MSIHIHEVRKLSKDLAAIMDIAQGESYFELKLSEGSIKEFKEILARGLNTAPPEKYPDWIALSDQLRDQEESELGEQS